MIAAVNGMACGGAFYLLGEAEFIVAAETPTFFDPHTTYGMVSAYEAIYMAQRMPFGEVARMSLMGTAERISARRAYEIGLVSELTAPGAAAAAALRRARSSPRSRPRRSRAPYGPCGRRRRRRARRLSRSAASDHARQSAAGAAGGAVRRPPRGGGRAGAG